ncbi:ubiquitin carboxyl-hydrolase [Bacteroides xylanisolvens]|uniref:ubiquitin carboxyl-hydrolase n=1 Tax=Bacteroides xylanisolvens TaxID=371601 RepID=UPI0039B6947E
MSNKKKETKVLCPRCGTEFATPKKEFTTVATVIGKDSGLGIVYPAVVAQDKPAKTAQERIEALRNAGVDVNNLFAMKGANGDEYIASNKDGRLAILDDDDPIFDHIISQGTVPNRLCRRWVMGQMFHMMSYTPYRSKEPVGVTYMIHSLGYEYQWKMLLNELHAQMKMEGRDAVNFADRNRWFNTDVIVAMAEDYIAQLTKRVDALKERKCKGVPYKRIRNRDIFVLDLQDKLYKPLWMAAARIKQAKNAVQLYNTAKKFNDMRIRMQHDTPQSKAWVDAYKGSGAFFTMQNLIRFHACVAIDDNGKRLDKYQSLAFLSEKAEMYKDGEGWRLLAVLKKMLSDNNIDIKKKMAGWRKKK